MEVAERVVLSVEVMTQPALGSQTAVSRMPVRDKKSGKVNVKGKNRQTVEEE